MLAGCCNIIMFVNGDPLLVINYHCFGFSNLRCLVNCISIYVVCRFIYTEAFKFGDILCFTVIALFVCRLPEQLGGAQMSLMPLYSVTASALFTSLLSVQNNKWGCLSEGILHIFSEMACDCSLTYCFSYQSYYFAISFVSFSVTKKNYGLFFGHNSP